MLLLQLGDVSVTRVRVDVTARITLHSTPVGDVSVTRVRVDVTARITLHSTPVGNEQNTIPAKKVRKCTIIYFKRLQLIY